MSIFGSKPKVDPLAFLAEYSDEALIHAMTAAESIFANAMIAYNMNKELWDKVIGFMKGHAVSIAMRLMMADDEARGDIITQLVKQHPQIDRIVQLYVTSFHGAMKGDSHGGSTAS